MDQSTFPHHGEVERWLPVVGYEGLYEVSDLGRVKGIRHQTPKGPRGGGLRKLFFRPNGYLTVRLMKEGAGCTYYVHRLVAAAFIGPCPEGEEVRHLDGIRIHNVASNLAYGDRSANMMDAVGHGTHPQSSKTHCDSGHEFTEVNTYVTPEGTRACRACRNDRQRDFQERRALDADRICTSEEGCDQPQQAKGLCKSHYGKQRHAAKMASTATCSKPGCDKPPFATGLCGGHYKKERRLALSVVGS